MLKTAAAAAPAKEASETATISERPMNGRIDKTLDGRLSSSDTHGVSKGEEELTAEGDRVEEPATTEPDRIQLMAYQLWLDRGCPLGSPDVDWSEAERLCQQFSE
jgi:hypothetical protein